MAEAVRDGKLVIPISQTLPLSKAGEAQAAGKRGRWEDLAGALNLVVGASNGHRIAFSRRTTDSYCGRLRIDRRAGLRVFGDLATATLLLLERIEQEEIDV